MSPRPASKFYCRQLVTDVSEEIDTIKWTVTGKVKRIIRDVSSSKDDIVFRNFHGDSGITSSIYRIQ